MTDSDRTTQFILDVYVPDKGAHGFVGKMLMLVQMETFFYGVAAGALTVSLLGFMWPFIVWAP